MAQRSFEQSITIAAAPAQVAPFFASYDQHTVLHPLIIAIQPIAARPAAPEARWYAITDRMQIGPLRFSFTYTAALRDAGDGTFISDAFQSPRVHLHNITRCQPQGAGTLVHEHVTIDAPRLLIGYVHQQALLAHRELLARLKQHIEAAQHGDGMV